MTQYTKTLCSYKNVGAERFVRLMTEDGVASDRAVRSIGVGRIPVPLFSVRGIELDPVRFPERAGVFGVIVDHRHRSGREVIIDPLGIDDREADAAGACGRTEFIELVVLKAVLLTAGVIRNRMEENPVVGGDAGDVLTVNVPVQKESRLPTAWAYGSIPR